MNSELSNVFIIGSPRSGTSALGWALAQHPDLWTSAETDILLYLLQKPWFHEQYKKALAEPNKKNWFIKHTVSYPEFASFIGSGLNQLFQSRSDGKIFVDSTPSYTTIAAELMIFFPNAKFLHIVRDGRAVVNSMLASGFSYKTYNNFRLACKSWVYYVNKGLEIEKAFPDRVLEVRNENLISYPEKELDFVFDFLGMESSTESAIFLRTKRVNSSYLNVQKDDIRKAKDPALMPNKPWKSWSRSKRFLFTRIAGETMNKLEYGIDFE
ncbi:MAG TPA: sulfotransferase [Gillisia sp.]|nr:sulfotransferase [Gillisia sp.]